MGQHQAGTQEKITTLTSATGLTASVYWGTSFGESLTNGILTSGTGWTANADMAAAGNAATYTHSTGAGTLTQAAGSMALTGRSGKVYDFTYTVSSPSGAAPTIVIDDDFAIVDTALIGLDTAGTYTVRFKTATTPGDFILSGTSTATGAVTLDALSLKEVQKDGWRNMQPKSAIITVETAAIRFCSDSSTPTTTAAGAFGEFANVGDVIKLDSTQEIINFRAINAVASSGSAIRVTYFY